MRAEEPVATGRIERDSVGIAYEVYGEGPLTLVLVPCWIIVHARQWKAQVADLAKDCRVVVVEGRGNGASDRPRGVESYGHDAYALDALAVMDHLGVGECVAFGFSQGGPIAALVAQQRPEQVKALVLIAPSGPASAEARAERARRFLEPLDRYKGWDLYTAGGMHADYRGFVEMFFAHMFPEPHSTKQIEDGIAYALETDAEALIDSTLGAMLTRADLEGAFCAVRCPVLLIHGDRDEIVPFKVGQRVAELCKAQVLPMPGSGHGPHMRHPALVNRSIRDFLEAQGLLETPRFRVTRAGRPRALYLSSPIGLGHVRRDLAVARALRRQRPELAVEWLAQDPVTRFLRLEGEDLHPASVRLAGESRHIESEAGEHDLAVFEALRRMDEILVRNFRVFQEVLEVGVYDLVIADEGWEIDHFWHEHPGMKRTPLIWMTDFVGFAPMPEGGAREALLTADYNAEMVDHVESHPGIRDRAIFVGGVEDVVDDSLGPDLPDRREWTQQRFDFSGYILGDGLPGPGERPALRRRFGFGQDEDVCVVSVGGSGVGAPLIRRIVAASALARRARPGLRTVVIAGPRLDPASFAAEPGVEFRGFEPDLPQLMAACDLGVVQGGLSTCMELTAVGTPFIYLPLQRHFEQNINVPQRLANYGAGRRMDFAETEPDQLAAAMLEELGARPTPRPVERDGAERAARMILEVL